MTPTLYAHAVVDSKKAFNSHYITLMNKLLSQYEQTLTAGRLKFPFMNLIPLCTILIRLHQNDLVRNFNTISAIQLE